MERAGAKGSPTAASDDRQSGAVEIGPFVYRFAREPLTDALIGDVSPLLAKHWHEVAHYKDIPLDPDWEAYRKLDAAGGLRIFTARDQYGTLAGYSVFVVRRNLHYRSSLQALQDVVFIDPERRGFGTHFIAECDAQLQAEGIQVVYHHVKLSHDWGKLLERLGYERIETIWGKRLDR